MKAFMGGFLGLECKEGIKESNHLSHFFDPRLWMDRGLKDESSHKILAQNSI